jgi:hypothetical protein
MGYLHAVSLLSGVLVGLVSLMPPLVSKSAVLVTGQNVLEPAGTDRIDGECVVYGTATIRFPYVTPPVTFNSASGRQVKRIPQRTDGQAIVVEKVSGSARVECDWSLTPVSTPSPNPTVTPTPTPTVTPTPPTPTPTPSPSQTPTPTPEPTPAPSLPTRLLQAADLAYSYAFRVPNATSQVQTLEWGGTGLAFWPQNQSLLIVGHDWYQQVGEITIPAASTSSATLNDLAKASWRQVLTDVTANTLTTIDGADATHPKIGGILPFGHQLIVSAWGYYDAGPPFQTKSHFVVAPTFQSPSATGPFQVGKGWQAYDPTDTKRIAGFVSGYMTPVPSEWQAALGCPALTGQGGYISILTRTSAGPSASCFQPADLGVTVPARAEILMGYPSGDGLEHQTLGQWGVNGGLYNGTQGFRGMVFVPGTASILFVGWGADEFCYGVGTADPALHLKPSNVTGRPYCYDPVSGGVGSLGTHGYPVTPIVWAYSAHDFLKVKAGTLKPWDVKPYATWSLNLPFQSRIVNGIETGHFEIYGAAFDPATRRLFLSAYRSDGNAPLIHVLRIN